MDRKEFNVLVTAGDTYESVDEVRRITHMATGRLGSLISDEFTKQGANVTYLCGERSLMPSLPVKKIIKIKGVLDLKNEMEKLLLETDYNCVVHSMAVSDYIVRSLATETDIIKEISELLKLTKDKDIESIVKDALNNAQYKASGKISSDLDNIVIFMDKAPKVISIVKELRPKAILVGFKLLFDVSEEELIKASERQIKSSGSDYVLANDLNSIDGDGHLGMLINNSGVIIERPSTKQEIAESIVRHVKEDFINGISY